MKYKIIITIILFIFSYFYTLNAASFIKENDTLMQEIKSKQTLYNQDSKDAIITNSTMIPGSFGYKINLDKSYQKMKSLHSFNEALLVFDEIPPNLSVNKHYDKVLLGNPNKEAVSVVIEADKHLLNALEKPLLESLETNPKYCLTDTLKIPLACLNQQYTLLVYPIKTNLLSSTKKLLKKGIILLYYVNDHNYNEFLLTIKYIHNNYSIIKIDDLIKETNH